MKILLYSLLIVAAVALVGSAAARAGTPTPAVDTVAVEQGKLTKFVARWNLVLATTPDTLISPAFGSQVVIVRKGALAAADTIKVAVAQGTYVPPFSILLSADGETATLDFRGRWVKKLVVKSAAGTPRAYITILN